MKKICQLFVRYGVVAAGVVASQGTAAQSYPVKPVTFVVPFAAGGPSDKVARDLATLMSRSLGQSIIVENVAGAGGTLGTARVARSDPDGYTLLVHHIAMATSPSLYRNLAYKTLEDFEYLGLVNESPMVVLGRPNLAASNFSELRQWLGANTGKANLAHAGAGSASHLCGTLFQQSLGLDMSTIPYKGTAPAMNDLLGGQVDLLCDQSTSTTAFIDSGKVKAFVVSTPKRLSSPGMKNVPTAAEVGLKNFNIQVYHGLYAPKRTPKAALDKINAALKEAIKDPEFVKRQEALGVSVVSDARVNPAQHKKFIEAEIAKWAVVLKAAGNYAD